MWQFRNTRRRIAPPALFSGIALAALFGGSVPSANASGTNAQPASASVAYSVGPISDVSAACPGTTGDTSEAADPLHGDTYVAFEGCHGDGAIGFARSTNAGESYSPALALPGSNNGWDPWLAVAPDGTLYAAFMKRIDHQTYPIIDVSHDGGQNFAIEQSLQPSGTHNWGDADYIAVGPDGTLYVSWDYGPSNAEVGSRCSANGSCWAVKGDLNVVMQSSTDDGKTFSPMSVVTPGYPDGGADMGDVTVAPDGAVDVLYQGYQVVDPATLKLANGNEYFTTSADGGRTWSHPVEVGAAAGQMTIAQWWNDVSLASDSAGNLYATWDTQGQIARQATDIGWISFSTDGGHTWSTPLRTTEDETDVPHIVEVTGAGSGRAYVAWLSSNNPLGYALYLRTFSVSACDGAGGWLSGATRVSQQFGDANVFPGDTFGIGTLSPTTVALGWGSAVPGSGARSAVFSATVKVVSR